MRPGRVSAPSRARVASPGRAGAEREARAAGCRAGLAAVPRAGWRAAVAPVARPPEAGARPEAARALPVPAVRAAGLVRAVEAAREDAAVDPERVPPDRPVPRPPEEREEVDGVTPAPYARGPGRPGSPRRPRAARDLQRDPT